MVVSTLNFPSLLTKLVKSKNSSNFALFLIIVVALIVRIWGLGDVGFNSDESVYSGQAANLAGNHPFAEHFSIFRAHPLLFQFMVSLSFEAFGVLDTNARMVSVIFAVSTIYVTFLIGSNLFNKRVGLVSAFILAILPYHVIVSRQAIVDVPYSLFFNLMLLFMIKYVMTVKVRQNKDETNTGGKLLKLNIIRSSRLKDLLSLKSSDMIWIYAIGFSAGLTFLSKEVGVIAVISVLVYLYFRRKIGLVKIIILLGVFILTISPHLIVLAIRDEASQNAFLYSQWQLSRPPNHPPSFYPEVLLSSLGFVLSGLCVLAVIHSIFSKQNRESVILLLTWIFIPLLFFQLWPTKGFYYMLPLIPAFVVLGISFISTNWIERIRHHKVIIIFIIILVPLSTNFIISIINPPEEQRYLAGSGGLPYAREAAQWIAENTPEGSVFMTIGPSMGNVIKFYSNRDTMAISTNPNPAAHNPSYKPIINPDYMLRSGQIQYIVYDMFSAARTQHFADKVLYYAEKFDGHLVYSEYETYTDKEGNVVSKPAILIYVINDIKGVR